MVKIHNIYFQYDRKKPSHAKDTLMTHCIWNFGAINEKQGCQFNANKELKNCGYIHSKTMFILNLQKSLILMRKKCRNCNTAFRTKVCSQTVLY